MELSGLIFVALALVWAVVLIPKALRHHDEVARTRSVDEVSETGRVLARRELVNDREARLVVPRKQVPASAPVAQGPSHHAAEPAPAPVVPPQRAAAPATRLVAHRAAAKAAARRRRMIVSALLLATAVTGVLVATGVLLPWAPAVPAATTLGFLVVARVLVRREHARWDAALADQRHAAVREAETPDVVEPLVEELGNAVVAAAVATREAPAVVSGLEETSPSAVGLLDVEPATDGGTLWDPLPVTLPTYVSKPRASRSVRTIDLADPRVSSSGRDAADSALVAEAATATPPAGGSSQRAVGS